VIDHSGPLSLGQVLGSASTPATGRISAAGFADKALRE
jgi:hypothetical protein